MVDNELINIRQDEQIDLHKLKHYLNELLKIDIDKINNISGMDITFVTSTNDDILAKSLLKELGLPFKKS